MTEDDRDSLGRFVPGRKPSLEELRRKQEGMKRHYETFIPSARLREQNPYIFNAWRAMLYTQKGKKIGCSTEEWKTFENFYADVSPTYQEGLKFHRIDTTLPFSKENFMWITTEQASAQDSNNLIKLEYKGELLSLKELAIKYEQPVNALKIRYHRHKDDYTAEEIIFGVKIARGSKKPKDAISKSQEERNKASRMISSYKCKDKKLGMEVCDFDIDWMLHNIIHQPCTYCGDTKRVGCDRIDNTKGHTKDNVVPCCYECNVARGDNFTYEEMLILGQTIKRIKERREDNH